QRYCFGSMMAQNTVVEACSPCGAQEAREQNSKRGSLASKAPTVCCDMNLHTYKYIPHEAGTGTQSGSGSGNADPGSASAKLCDPGNFLFPPGPRSSRAHGSSRNRIVSGFAAIFPQHQQPAEQEGNICCQPLQPERRFFFFYGCKAEGSLERSKLFTVHQAACGTDMCRPGEQSQDGEMQSCSGLAYVSLYLIVNLLRFVLQASRHTKASSSLELTGGTVDAVCQA
ncbi:hypothetical protein STEG23_019417, partial [Scotinomys teguina]